VAGSHFSGLHQPHVRTALPANSETKPLESLDNCCPGKIAGEFHTATRIGSLMKWRRIRRGVSSSSK
jgi:hypothetical protein